MLAKLLEFEELIPNSAGSEQAPKEAVFSLANTQALARVLVIAFLQRTKVVNSALGLFSPLPYWTGTNEKSHVHSRDHCYHASWI